MAKVNAVGANHTCPRLVIHVLLSLCYQFTIIELHLGGCPHRTEHKLGVGRCRLRESQIYVLQWPSCVDRLHLHRGWIRELEIIHFTCLGNQCLIQLERFILFPAVVDLPLSIPSCLCHSLDVLMVRVELLMDWLGFWIVICYGSSGLFLLLLDSLIVRCC